MIEVKVKQDAINELTKKIDKLSSKTPNAAKKAVNKTAREVKKLLAIEAKAKYTLKRAKFNSDMRVQSASVENLEAVISASGEPIPLINFKVSKGKRATKVQVLKEGGLKKLNSNRGSSDDGINAFVNNIANKAQVRKKDTAKGKAGTRVIHVAVAQRQGDERLKIKEMYGNSVPKMLEKTFDDQKKEIEKRLKENIQKHVKAVIGG